ncbi:MAG: hypothetical protein Q9212_002942 [Teloschistes hypoglaucus]
MTWLDIIDAYQGKNRPSHVPKHQIFAAVRGPCVRAPTAVAKEPHRPPFPGQGFFGCTLEYIEGIEEGRKFGGDRNRLPELWARKA